MPSAPINATSSEDAPNGDLETQYAKISDQLSQLSQADEFPAGFDGSTEAFDPETVSFESEAWFLSVIQVQAWLYLDETVRIDTDSLGARSSVHRLYSALGAEDPDDCFDEIDGLIRPTISGANMLSIRCDSAVYLQQRFQELRDKLSRKQATADWSELWEEETSEEAELGPIQAKTSIWPIQEFSDKARKSKLNLSPSYQRGNVWPTGHCQLLIVSILRGIPLPSIILLKPQAEGASGIYEVVDGKQRLTSILRFIGKHPGALRKVDEADQLVADVGFKDLFSTNYKKFRRLWKTHLGESLTAVKEAEYYFPFRLPAFSPGLKGSLEELQGKYFYEIRDTPIQIGNNEETVGEVFESVSEYKVPVIEYIDAAPRQVHEVFHLYNRQGKHLNAEEIRNALFHQLKLIRLLLVAAGDNNDVSELAPYIEDSDRWKLLEVADTLTNYRFGEARYRRTKLLSWLTALILQPALQGDGSLVVRSTAKQINALLETIEKGLKDAQSMILEEEDTLRQLVDDLQECLEVHSSFEGWDPRFQDDKDGSKWQELQLVASLVGVFLVCTASDDPLARLEEHTDEILRFTASHPRPAKTQNKTQWAFIGEVAIGIAEIVGVDFGDLEEKLRERYDTSCVMTLRAAAEHYEAEQ